MSLTIPLREDKVNTMTALALDTCVVRLSTVNMFIVRGEIIFVLGGEGSIYKAAFMKAGFPTQAITGITLILHVISFVMNGFRICTYRSMGISLGSRITAQCIVNICVQIVMWPSYSSICHQLCRPYILSIYIYDIYICIYIYVCINICSRISAYLLYLHCAGF